MKLIDAERLEKELTEKSSGYRRRWLRCRIETE